jgi:predicted transcriptional regulator
MIKLSEQIFSREDVTPQEFRLYAQLVYLCQKRETNEVAVTQGSLSKMCGFSRSTVNKFLQELSKKGLIGVVRRNRPDRGQDASIYILKELN